VSWSDELGSRVCPGELFQASTGVFPAPRTTGSMRQFNGKYAYRCFRARQRGTCVSSTVAVINQIPDSLIPLLSLLIVVRRVCFVRYSIVCL
jgi:hypothetical protein